MALSIARQMQDAEISQAGERLRVSFDVVVSDPAALWHAAARVALRQAGRTIADVEDVLGPIEDPALADCLAMLTAPDALPGCMPLRFAAAALARPQHAALRQPKMRS